MEWMETFFERCDQECICWNWTSTDHDMNTIAHIWFHTLMRVKDGRLSKRTQLESMSSADCNSWPICNLDKNILQFGQIYLEVWTNIFGSLDKYILQFEKVLGAMWTNTLFILEKYILEYDLKFWYGQRGTFEWKGASKTSGHKCTFENMRIAVYETRLVYRSRQIQRISILENTLLSVKGRNKSMSSSADSSSLPRRQRVKPMHGKYSLLEKKKEICFYRIGEIHIIL